MAKYIIKNNLPDGIISPVGAMGEFDAERHFLGLANHLTTNGYSIKVAFRNKPLRGRIQAEIDGFYYYVELYKSE